MVIDASVLLAAFFPDEAQPQALALLRRHAAGQPRLKAPRLLRYEVENAVWQAERRGRIQASQAAEILQAAAALGIEMHDLEWGASLSIARRFNRGAYDANYLALAESLGEPLVTGDLRLYNAVKAELPWVLWMEDIPRD